MHVFIQVGFNSNGALFTQAQFNPKQTAFKVKLAAFKDKNACFYTSRFQLKWSTFSPKHSLTQKERLLTCNHGSSSGPL